MKKNSQDLLIKNRRAWHDYEIIDTLEAGIALVGTEVKSVREHHVSLQEAYINIIDGQLFLIGATINAYKFGNIYNHEEKRDRKLLMHKYEIDKLKTMQQKGFALVPLGMYVKRGHIKVKVGIGRGKKKFDKRSAIKERDEKRRMQQAQRVATRKGR